MKADVQTEKEVKAVLNKMAESYKNRNIDELLSICSPDPDNVMFGTGPDEKRIGLDEIRIQAERDWAQTDEGALVYDWISVSEAGNVAWIAADITFNVKMKGHEMILPGRLTAVFENREKGWLIAQSHFSFPTSEQKEGQSFPD